MTVRPGASAVGRDRTADTGYPSDLACAARESNTGYVTNDADHTYDEARRGKLPERVLPGDWVEMKAVERAPDLPPSAGDPEREWPLRWAAIG